MSINEITDGLNTLKSLGKIIVRDCDKCMAFKHYLQDIEYLLNIILAKQEQIEHLEKYISMLDGE